jgi:hypothetical protein
MSKLFKLKKWLTLPDAAKHLSTIFEEEVTEADVLRLALDGHLKLSVHFVNHAAARPGKVVPIGDAKKAPGIPKEGREHYDVILGLPLNDREVLEFDKQIVSLDGVWDLPMMGAEALDVEHRYQWLTGGPEVTLTSLEGTFVAGENGQLCQLQEHFADNKYFKKKNLKKPRNHPDNYYPANALPRDSVLVVRTEAVTGLYERISTPDAPKEKPLGNRERDGLLKQIAALALVLAEPVFANITPIPRLDRFTFRGKRKVNAQWLLYCLHNIGNIHCYAPGFT